MGKKRHPEHVNHERWLVSYADFITLLFAFFVVMFAVSQVDSKKVGRFTESFQQAIGMQIAPGGEGIMPADGVIPQPPPQKKRGGKDGKEDDLKAIEQELAARARIKQELSGLKVVRRGNELVLRLEETVLFPSGGEQLQEPALVVLRAIAEEIKGRPVRIRVEGHTDDRPIANGRYRSNWDLSTARATSVVKELATAGTIEPQRLAAVGYAEYQPVGDNATEEGRAQNRRVDFVLTLDLPLGGSRDPLGGTDASAPVEPTSSPPPSLPQPSGEPPPRPLPGPEPQSPTPSLHDPKRGEAPKAPPTPAEPAGRPAPLGPEPRTAHGEPANPGMRTHP